MVSRMSEKVKAMVRDSLDAFVNKDIKLAEDDSGAGRRSGLAEGRDLPARSPTCMKTNPDRISHALDLLIISRNLERIGDHATNIAEDVIYMVAGKDIRHHILETPRLNGPGKNPPGTTPHPPAKA